MNGGFDYRERLGPGAAGLPALDYLSKRYRHSGRQLWRRRIESGRVLVDGCPITPSTLLRAGRLLVWRRPPWQEPDAPLCFAVLYRDDECLAVAKPAGLPTLPAGGYLENTLLSLVRRYDPVAHPLHRIDRGTSGLVLFARDRVARSRLAAAWRAGEVVRAYRGLIRGVPPRRCFVIDHPIGRIPAAGRGGISSCAPDGAPARTGVTVLERRQENALVEITIATGRSHQIRIHLAAAGHPLVGEPFYGPGGRPRRGASAVSPGCPPLPGDGGYSLHATRLTFPHPRDDRRIEISCPPPPSLRRRNRVQ